MKNLDEIRQRLAASTVRASQHKLLAPGPYSFKITDAKERQDGQRGYEYVYIELSCQSDGAVVVTQDRFALVDAEFWLRKLNSLLAAVGLDSDSWSSVRQLIGRTGELVAEAKGTMIVHHYQPGVSS